MGYLSCRTEAAIGTHENAHLKHKRHRPANPQVFKFVVSIPFLLPKSFTKLVKKVCLSFSFCLSVCLSFPFLSWCFEESPIARPLQFPCYHHQMLQSLDLRNPKRWWGLVLHTFFFFGMNWALCEIKLFSTSFMVFWGESIVLCSFHVTIRCMSLWI